MALRGKQPTDKPRRLKFFVYGPSAVGKTTAAIQFPNAYIIDTENGTDNYGNLIKKAGSVVFQSNNIDDIIIELNNLLTERHNYRTLIIDPITIIYQSIQEKWDRIFSSHAKSDEEAEVGDWGMRYWGKVKKDYKALQRKLIKLDMNIIVTAHQKDVYNGNSKVGISYDSMKGDDYFFDIVIRTKRIADKLMAMVEKERSELGAPKFPEQFEWNYNNFINYFGKDDIERISNPITLADVNSVNEVKRLLDIVKLDNEQINKWFDQANVEAFSEMTEEQINKITDFLRKKIDG
jgi:hypothetical protein